MVLFDLNTKPYLPICLTDLDPRNYRTCLLPGKHVMNRIKYFLTMEGTFLKQRNALYAELHDKHYKMLCFRAGTIVGDPAVAEDIVSDLVIKVLETKPELDTVEAIKAYLITSVRNKAIDHVRRTKWEQPMSPYLEQEHLEEDDPAELTAELFGRIDNFMKTLPKKQRVVLEKVFLEGKTAKEASVDLRTTIQNIHKHKAKGLRAILNKAKVVNLRLFLALTVLFASRYRN